MKKSILKSALSIVLAVTLLMSSAVCAFAANSDDVIVVYDINLTEVTAPYAGQTPQYTCNLNTPAYYFDNQLDNDPDVVKGKWWYDKTTDKAVNPNDTFIEGHVYTLVVLLLASDGYEFRVANDNTPLVKAKINGKEAEINTRLTNKSQACVNFTFEPCGYDPKVSEVMVDITEPVTGNGPDYYPNILTDGVTTGDIDSPYYIEGVAWYDYTTKTFMNPSDDFRDGYVYEVLIVLTTKDDAYFATKDSNSDVTAYVNGSMAVVESAGKDNKHHILVSYAFGDIREEVSSVKIKNIDTPKVGANPDFTASPASSAFSITGVYWTDVTNSTPVTLKETDVFQAGHTYKLEVWIRANAKYKFTTDEDDFVAVTALINDKQADVMLPGSQISAELAVTYTLAKPSVISFVDIGEVDEPVAGKLPDMTAFCYTNGCNVDTVAWYDTINGKVTEVAENEPFKEGHTYTVVVGVLAEGLNTFEMVDGYNEATGAINGERANSYGSHDATFVEFYYTFAPCKPSVELLYGDVDLDGNVSVSDVTHLQLALARSITLNAEQEVISDVNSDGTLSIDDVTLIQLYLAKIVTSFR